MEMEPDSIPKTACHIIWVIGISASIFLPEKRCSCSGAELMESVLREMKGKCCMMYIDDVVIYSKNEQEHFQHIQRQGFQCLFKAGHILFT